MQAKILIMVEWVTLLPRIFGYQGSNLAPEVSLCIFFSIPTKCQDNITALIPQSLQLQVQVILVMLSSFHK
jgi:hypothetical protein